MKCSNTTNIRNRDITNRTGCSCTNSYLFVDIRFFSFFFLWGIRAKCRRDSNRAETSTTFPHNVWHNTHYTLSLRLEFIRYNFILSHNLRQVRFCFYSGALAIASVWCMCINWHFVIDMWFYWLWSMGLTSTCSTVCESQWSAWMYMGTLLFAISRPVTIHLFGVAREQANK